MKKFFSFELSNKIYGALSGALICGVFGGIFGIVAAAVFTNTLTTVYIGVFIGAFFGACGGIHHGASITVFSQVVSRSEDPLYSTEFFDILVSELVNKPVSTLVIILVSGLIGTLFSGLFIHYIFFVDHDIAGVYLQFLQRRCELVWTGIWSGDEAFSAATLQEKYPDCVLTPQEMEKLFQEDFPKAARDCQDTPQSEWNDNQHFLCPLLIQ